MVPVMYHYIRPGTSLRYFPYLDLENFQRQLNWFEAHYGFVSRADYCNWLQGGEAPEGVLLTFDDGLRDHFDFVLPELQQRRLFGIFFVPTAPLETGAVLDVHKVHLAIGRVGGTVSRAWLEAHAPGLLAAALDEANPPSSYAQHDSNGDTKRVKQFFNLCLTVPERHALLEGLLDFAFRGRPPLASEIYLDACGLRALADAGMAIGPHGHNHLVLGKLEANVQRTEIAHSCTMLEQLGGDRRWGFCYPYGGQNAFDERSKAAVEASGCPLAFATHPGNIAVSLADSPRFALPRHNCNSFAHGAASYGDAKRISAA